MGGSTAPEYPWGVYVGLAREERDGPPAPVARAVGIDEVIAEVLAQDKVDAVKPLATIKGDLFWASATTSRYCRSPPPACSTR